MKTAIGSTTPPRPQAWMGPKVDCVLQGAQVLRPEGMRSEPLALADGRIATSEHGRVVDLRGYWVLPGIIDLHGDGFERHVAPRRGAMKSLEDGLISAEAELAANGITTAYLAQFFSWEGGVRGPDFAAQVFEAIGAVRDTVITDLRAQLRFETHLLEDYATLPERIAQWAVGYVVFNDHLPHDRLAKGQRPKSLTGQALKAGRNPEKHLAYLQELHARRPEVSAALETLCAQLRAAGVTMGSHDDHTASDRSAWRAKGVSIAEFPESLDAAEAAKSAGDTVILGAPNVVRGGSHKRNVSALDVIAMGLCDALASDYHYPSPRRAALMLAKSGVLDIGAAWNLLSAGPARVMGLSDRGRLAPGLRADLVILDAQSGRVAGCMVEGRFSFLSGALVNRFIG